MSFVSLILMYWNRKNWNKSPSSGVLCGSGSETSSAASSLLQAGLLFILISMVGAYSSHTKCRAWGAPAFTFGTDCASKCPLPLVWQPNAEWVPQPQKPTQLENFKQMYVFLVNVMEPQQVNVSNPSKRLKQSCKYIISAGRFPVLCSRPCFQALIYKINCTLI